MKFIRRLWLAALTFLMCAFSAGSAHALPPTARLIPAETAFLINIDDFTRLHKQFKKTGLFRLYKDPAMAAFVQSFRAGWTRALPGQNNELIKAVVDANVLPTGRVAAALVYNHKAAKSNELPFLLICQWGRNLNKVKKAVDRAVKKTLECGARQVVESYRGQIIITILKPRLPNELPSISPDRPSDKTAVTPVPQNFPGKITEGSINSAVGPRVLPAEVKIKAVKQPPVNFSYCFMGRAEGEKAFLETADACLVAAFDVDVLKFVIAHMLGATAGSLASDADYIATMKTIGPYHDIDGYLNLKHIIKTAVVKDSSGKAGTYVAGLGLDNLTAFGFALDFSRQAGASISGKALLKVNGPKKGILKLPATKSAAINPPRFIGPAACSLSFVHLDIKTAYDELFKVLSGIDPVLAAAMTVPLVQPGENARPAVELKKDIVDYLDSGIVFARIPNKSCESASTPTSTIFCVAHTNRKMLERSLSLWHGKRLARSNPDAPRELLGHTIYKIELPNFSLPVPDMAPMQGRLNTSDAEPTRLAFTVTDTHLVLGAGPSVEKVVRRLTDANTDTIGSTRWFKAAGSVVPAAVGFAQLSNDAACAEAAWPALKQGTAANFTLGMTNLCTFWMSLTARNELADFSLLPQFDAVRRHFGLSASYGFTRADGFYFEFRQLFPKF